MKRLFSSFVALFFLAVSAHAADKIDWTLDKAHSHVGFSVRHLGISKVNGEFKEFDGKVVLDPQSGKLSSVEGEVRIASVDTGVDARDKHLLSGDFFDAAKFPLMTLKTKSISYNGDKLTAVADLTIKGVTKTVTLTGDYLGTRTADFGQGKTLRTGYSVSTVINRQDFGLQFNMLAEGVSVVGNDVTIQLDVELFKAL